MDRKELLWTYAKLLMTALFWGGTFIAGRVVVRHVGPYSASFLRFAIAAVLLAGLAWRIEGGNMRLKAGQLLPLLVLGLTGVFAYNIFFLKGLKLIEAGRASMIIANNPILIALCSALFFKERLTAVRFTGILLSIVGAVVVISRGHLGSLFQGGIGPGEFLLFGCVASWVTYSLVGKVLLRQLRPLPSVTYSVLVGALALSVPAFHEGLLAQIGGYTLTDWLCLAYLGVFGTVFGFVWFLQGIQKIGATRAGLFINFVPISAVLLSFCILGEPLTASLLIGAVLVTTGVYLTNAGDRRELSTQ
jgi:drug/metabolite transporter (DMT)-like permease